MVDVAGSEELVQDGVIGAVDAVFKDTPHQLSIGRGIAFEHHYGAFPLDSPSLTQTGAEYSLKPISGVSRDG